MSLSKDCELYGLPAGLVGELDCMSNEFCDLSNVNCPLDKVKTKLTKYEKKKEEENIF